MPPSGKEFLLLSHAIDTRNWRTAAEHAQNCLQAGDDRPLVYGYLAMAKAHLGEEAEAIRLAGYLRREAPDDAQHLTTVGYVFALCDEPLKAEGVLAVARRIDPEDLRCLGLLCHLAVTRRQSGELETRLKQFAEAGADPVDVIRFKGHLAKLLGRSRDAAVAFREVLRHAPEDFVAHFRLAQIHFEQADPLKAREHAAAAARINHQDVTVRNLVQVLDAMDNWPRRAWFKLSCWFNLPGFGVQKLAVMLPIVALLVTLSVMLVVYELSPLIPLGVLFLLFYVLELRGRRYLARLVEMLKAAERKVEISADY